MLETVSLMSRKNIVSGQLFFRNKGPSIALDHSTRQLFSVCGIVAIPENFEIVGEHQHTVVGYYNPIDGIVMSMDTKNPIDLSEEAKGNTLSNLLLRPLWRI